MTDSDLTVLILREIRDQISETNSRLGRMDERLGRVDERLGNVERELGSVRGELGLVRKTLVKVARHVMTTSDRHDVAIDDLRERVSRLEAAPAK